MATGGEEPPRPPRIVSLCSDTLPDQPCQPCEADGKQLEATGYCENCAEYLCEDCYSCHTRPTPLRNHRLLRVAEGTVIQTDGQRARQSLLQVHEVSVLSRKDEPITEGPMLLPDRQIREGTMPVQDGQIGEQSLLISSASMRLTIKCDEHEEVIKYFCETHEKLSCDVCMTVHHKNCTDISYIPVVARNTTASNEYKEFSKQLKLTEDKANDVISDTKSQVEQIRHSHSMAKTAREEFKKELDKILDKQLAKLNILAVSAELQETERLDTVVNSFMGTLAELQALAASIDNPSWRTHLDATIDNPSPRTNLIATLDNPTQRTNLAATLNTGLFTGEGCLVDNPPRRTNQCSLYIKLKQAKEKLAYLEHLLQTVRIPELKQCRFEPGKQLIDLLQRGNVFGRSVIEPVRETRVSHYKDINVRTQSDTEECRITGLACLNSTRVVAIDNKNRKVKLIDTRRGKVASWLKFSHPLWDVARISAVRVVATIPEGERLAIIKADPLHDIVIEYYIKVSGRCHGVAFTGEMLVVTITDNFPDKVELLDLRGKLLRSITTDNAGEWIFRAPKYASYSSTTRKTYISNWDNHSVVTLTHNGSINSVDKFDDLNMPGNVVHDGKRRMYVSDYEANAVQQLSVDLQTEKTLITGQDGILGPSCACYDSETDRLIVGIGTATLKVFQVSN